MPNQDERRLRLQRFLSRVDQAIQSGTVKGPPSATPEATAPRNIPSDSAIRRPKEYEPMGSGKVSNGNCTCKGICNKFAALGQLSGAKIAQCKSDCEQKYAGCNKGALR